MISRQRVPFKLSQVPTNAADGTGSVSATRDLRGAKHAHGEREHGTQQSREMPVLCRRGWLGPENAVKSKPDVRKRRAKGDKTKTAR
jgi:hypothetical protein